MSDVSKTKSSLPFLQKLAFFLAAILLGLVVYTAVSSSRSLSNEGRVCEEIVVDVTPSPPPLEDDKKEEPIAGKMRLEEIIPNVRIIYRDAPWVRKNCGSAPFKGRRILINYAQNCCQRSQPKNCQTGLETGGFDVCLMYNLTSIDDDFKQRNQATLNIETGAGLWVWKPYVVLKTLLAMDEDDVLFYADSGTHFLENVDDGPICLLAKQKGDIAVFTGEHEERKYTKADAFLLLGCEEDKCQHGSQLTASFVLLRKTWRSIQFVSQWLSYANDLRILSNEPSRIAKQGEWQGFVAHRNEQSIISILAKKWDIEHWPNPSQWGERPFGQRLRNKSEWSADLNKTFILHTRDKS